MRTPSRHVCAPLTLLLLGACGQSTGLQNGREESLLDSSIPFIATNSDSYQSETGQIQVAGQSIGYVEFSIPITYTNRSTEPVYLEMQCFGGFARPPLLERLATDRWETAHQRATSTCMGVPLGIEPGETYTYELRVKGYDPNARVTANTPSGPEESRMGNTWLPDQVNGTYRIRWNYALRTAPDIGAERVPLEQAISNTFRLTGTLPW